MRLALSALALGALVLAATPALAGDIIELKGGKTNPANASIPPTADDYGNSQFTVVEENLDKIVFKLAGLAQAQSVDTDKVAQIWHDPSTIPDGLARGRRMIENGQTGDGRAAVEHVAGDRRAPSWARAEAGYLVAYSHYLEGDARSTAAALATFLAEHKESRWRPAAMKLNARTLVSLGKVDEARAAFGALKSVRGISDEDKLEADYWLAWIDEKLAEQKGDKGLYDKALKAYEGVLSVAKGRSGMEDLAAKCTVGKAACLVGTGRYGDAETLLTKTVDSSKDPLVRAGAYTILGRGLLLEKGSSADRTVYKTALFHFQRVVTLYGNEPGAEEFMAESLYQSGVLFSELKPLSTATDEDKEAASMARARARREWQECASRFPGTSWGQKAKQKMVSGG